MKKITDLMNSINESKKQNVNILVQNSGSFSYNKDDVNNIIKLYKNVNLYYFDEKGVHEAETIKDIPFAGPHINDYNIVGDFTKKHLGEFTIILAN